MIVDRRSMTDATLAAPVLAGDGQAFAELAHRYRELIGFTTRNPAEGHDVDDERQEALLALREACRIYNPARGSFGAIATVRVRSRVWNSRRNRILTDALHLEHRAVEEDESDSTLADTIADREGTDPARVIELREELRERMIRRRADYNAKRRARCSRVRGQLASRSAFVRRDVGDAVYGARTSTRSSMIWKSAPLCVSSGTPCTLAVAAIARSIARRRG